MCLIPIINLKMNIILKMSDSDSDSDFDNTDNFISKDMKKIYQIQFVSEDKYKLTHVGVFTSVPSIELHKFEHKIDNFEYSCFISNNFVEFQDSFQDNPCLFDMITMDIIRTDGKISKLYLSVEIEKVSLENENKGNLMIWYEYNDKKIPLKSNLSHPGNEKLPYYIIAELKNDKVIELLKE